MMTAQEAFDCLEKLLGRRLRVTIQDRREMAKVDQIDPACGPETRCVLRIVGDPGRQCFRSVAEVATAKRYQVAEAVLAAATDAEVSAIS